MASLFYSFQSHFCLLAYPNCSSNNWMFLEVRASKWAVLSLYPQLVIAVLDPQPNKTCQAFFGWLNMAECAKLINSKWWSVLSCRLVFPFFLFWKQSTLFIWSRLKQLVGILYIKSHDLRKACVSIGIEAFHIYSFYWKHEYYRNSSPM